MSISRWMDKQTMASTYKGLEAIRRNEVLLPATIWMSFESVIHQFLRDEFDLIENNHLRVDPKLMSVNTDFKYWIWMEKGENKGGNVPKQQQE